MPPRLVTKGDMTSRRVLSVVFKILKCTSHLGIGLVWKQLAGLARCAWHSRAEVLRFGRAPPIRALPSVRREYPVT